MQLVQLHIRGAPSKFRVNLLLKQVQKKSREYKTETPGHGFDLNVFGVLVTLLLDDRMLVETFSIALAENFDCIHGHLSNKNCQRYLQLSTAVGN